MGRSHSQGTPVCFFCGRKLVRQQERRKIVRTVDERQEIIYACRNRLRCNYEQGKARA